MLALCMLAAVSLASRSLAADGQPARGSGASAERRPAGSVDPRTGRVFNQAIEQLAEERYTEARSTLETLSPDRLSPYERSRLELLHVNADLAQERYPSARDHLRAALASGGLNDVEISESRFRIGQIYAAEEHWSDCATELVTWLETAPRPTSEAFYTLAVCHYRADAREAAVQAAQTCVDRADRPKEAWLQLLVALRLERTEYALARPLLLRLVAMAPAHKAYWLQLSQTSSALDDAAGAAAALQIAYQGDLLHEDPELRRLAETLSQVGIPYRAARTLARELEQRTVEADARSLELLANLWIAARESERAIEPLEQAARLADSGRLHLRLAEVHVQQEEWAAAETAARAAIEKGKLARRCRADLLLGIATQAQRELRESRAALERASGSKPCKREAESWLRFVEQQLKGAPTDG